MRTEKDLTSLLHTHTVVMNILHQHDLPPWACVNKYTDTNNEHYRKTCKHLKNVRCLVDTSTCSRNQQTRQRPQSSRLGKFDLSIVVRLGGKSQYIVLGY